MSADGLVNAIATMLEGVKGAIDLPESDCQILAKIVRDYQALGKTLAASVGLTERAMVMVDARDETIRELIRSNMELLRMREREVLDPLMAECVSAKEGAEE